MINNRIDRRQFVQLLASSALLSITGCNALARPSSVRELALMDGMSTANAINSGHLSALEVVDAAISRIEQLNPQINAMVTDNFGAARSRARKAEEGKLWGVPILIKDLSSIEGIRHTYGSKMFANTVGEKETDYTKAIRDAGMILLGKSNTPEFGLLPTTEPLLFGACHNPWKLGHSSGGSSGGSAAAVAARMVPIAQSSDGGGSIRIPGAMNGVVGLKPSHERFPDQASPVRFWPISIRNMNTMSVRDTAMTLALTENAQGPLNPVGFVTGASSKKYRIALTLTGGNGIKASAEVERNCKDIAQLLEKLGHNVEIVEATPLQDPALEEAFLNNWAVGAAGVVEALEKRTGKRAEDTGLLEPFTTSIARSIVGDLESYRADVVAAFEKIQRDTNSFLDTYDLWLTPVATTVAPEHGYLAPTVDYDVLLERALQFVPYTLLHNVAWTPAISVPSGFSETSGLPLAVQFASALGREDKLLDIAYQIEQEQPWSHKIPPFVKRTLNL